MIYGCAGVSTNGQDLTNRAAHLKGTGCVISFHEKINDAAAGRVQLKKPMATLTAGDVGIVSVFDGLSCDTTDLLVIALAMKWTGADLLAELVVTMPGVAPKLERRRLIESTARSRADATAQRMKFDRKPKLTVHPQPSPHFSKPYFNRLRTIPVTGAKPRVSRCSMRPPAERPPQKSAIFWPSNPD